MTINWERRKYTKDEFRKSFVNSSNWTELAEKLNLKSSSSSIIPSLKKAAEDLSLDYSHFKGSTKYSYEDISKAVRESFSYTNVLKILGLKPVGGNFNHISKRIKQFDIDTSHFTGQSYNKGKVSYNRKNPEEILVLGEPTDRKRKREQLKRCMIEVGIQYICNSCYIEPTWNGKSLVLEINHINGLGWDNQKDNLEFLCPNCHSQEITSNKPYKYRNA